MRQVLAYYRVSTSAQGQSGLGLEAQEHAVAALCAARGFHIAHALTEVESGANRKRPVFAEARALCRKHKLLLVIAKIDRLSRDVGFICALRDSGVEFMAADMPDANRLTVTLMAAIAEHEREAIAARTKAALAAKKARGFKLGSPCPERGAAAGRAVISERVAAYRARTLPVVEEIQRSGVTSLAAVAAALNARGVPTSRGGENRWHAASVRQLLQGAARQPAALPVSTAAASGVKIPWSRRAA